MEHAKALDKRVWIRTLGSLFSRPDTIRRLKTAGVDIFYLPIYGTTNAVYAAVTGIADGFDVFERAVANCCEAGLAEALRFHTNLADVFPDHERQQQLEFAFVTTSYRQNDRTIDHLEIPIQGQNGCLLGHGQGVDKTIPKVEGIPKACYGGNPCLLDVGWNKTKAAH